LLAVVIAGFVQLVFGFLKAGVIGYYFPSSVIKGMLSGIGIIIILKQIPHALGYDKSPEGDFAFMQVDGQNTFSELSNMLNFITPGAVIIAAVSLGILILWEQPFMKRSVVSKIIQGPLVAVLAGISLNLAFMGGALGLNGDQMVRIPVPESLGGFFSQFTFPDFSQITNSAVWVTALTIAVVASLETLLCVEATDKLDPQKRVTPTNRELTAQGVGNMLSGLVGGLPITQVIVRSSANIQSGGRTKASAFVHGILLLVTAMTIPHLLNLIPLASLAAILFLVGYKLAKPALFVAMYKMGRSQFIPFMVTIVGIVFTDLLMGIGMGLVVAIFHILWNNYKVPYHFDPKDYKPGEKVRIQLAEDVSFLNKASIQRTLNSLPSDAQVVIDASRARTIHPDILEIFEDFRTNGKNKNIQLELVGMTPEGVKIKTPYDPVRGFNQVVAPENLERKRSFRSILAN
jgi:MFS superfamily sulfate permease-like transporter